jgi:hypothetical protein
MMVAKSVFPAKYSIKSKPPHRIKSGGGFGIFSFIKSLNSHAKIAQSIVQRHFFVRTRRSFADNQGTTDLKFARRELFCVSPRNHNRTRRHYAL